MPFADALALAHTLRLVSSREWKLWWKNGMHPVSLPSRPDRVYKDGGWQGWVHWLGSGNVKKASKFAPFGQALTFAQSLGLANQKEWWEWCNGGVRPPNVPCRPDQAYKDGGWQGWGHWLGTGSQSSHATKAQFLPFVEALAVARSLGRARMSGRVEWEAWCRNGMRPPNMPARPDLAYKDSGWQGWVHWLGSGSIRKASKFAPFGQALTFDQSLGLANQKEWKAWCKEGRRPPNVPTHPDRTYKDGGWQGWGHWLGTGNAAGRTKKNFLPFNEALRVARSLRLVSSKEWRVWCRSGARPANVPATPDKAYVHDGWMGWTHWLYHANLGPAAAPAATRPGTKRVAAECAGASSGKSEGKRRRR